MIFGKRKREKIKRNIIDNLTYCRLQGDLYAVEASIRDNAPKEKKEEGGVIRKFVNEIINEFTNAAKRVITRELTVDKEKAKTALEKFRTEHKDTDLSISQDTEKFRKYIDKHLFSKDTNGLKKISFALSFAIDERNQSYQCPEESLEVVSEILFDDHKKLGTLYSKYKNNYIEISKTEPTEFKLGFNLGMGIGGVLAMSLLPIGVGGIFAFVDSIRSKRAASNALKNMSPDEANAAFAYALTLIEVTRELDGKERKRMIDELLSSVDNARSDAEYKWFAEMDNIPDCKEKIAICDNAIKRLSIILGV